MVNFRLGSAAMFFHFSGWAVPELNSIVLDLKSKVGFDQGPSSQGLGGADSRLDPLAALQIESGRSR
jgi:hypothetical protein